MLESLMQYWYMWVLLAVLIVIMFWAGGKASKAVRRKNEILRKQEEEIKRYKYLVDKYSGITASQAENETPGELAEGITAVLQKQLERAVHPEEEFNNAEEWRRTVYSLYYFLEDTKTSLSFFFKNNGEPVTGLAVNGIKEIDESAVYGNASRMYAMYDENNESVSIDNDRINEINSRFKEIFNKEKFLLSLKNYIISNLQN